MSYKVIITDDSGHEVLTEIVDATDLLIAGILAEDILDQYHLEHPCKNCKHKTRCVFNKMKGGPMWPK